MGIFPICRKMENVTSEIPFLVLQDTFIEWIYVTFYIIFIKYVWSLYVSICIYWIYIQTPTPDYLATSKECLEMAGFLTLIELGQIQDQ